MMGLARYVLATVWTVMVLALSACAAPIPVRAPTAVPSIPAAAPSRVENTRPPLPPTSTPRRVIITPLPPIAASPTPRASQFDDVDARTLLSALFPDLYLTPRVDDFQVNGNPNWTMWVNSRAEGQFIQDGVPELAAIIANEAPQITPADVERTAPWGSFLAIFQKRGGKLQMVHRSYPFPTAISPLAFDVRIARVSDFDHDGQNELLITTTASRMSTFSTAAFLYQWNDQEFVPIWSAPIGEDNTAAINQPAYFASASEIRLQDVDGDGLDEIYVTTTRVDYGRNTQGLADTDRQVARRTEQRVFRWGGADFVPDPTRTTPLPPLPSPTR